MPASRMQVSRLFSFHVSAVHLPAVHLPASRLPDLQLPARRCLTIVALLAALFSHAAVAQSYPLKPIRMIQKAVSGEIARRWNGEVNKLLTDAKFVDRYLAPMAVTASGGTPEFFTNFIKSDRATAGELVKLAKMTLIEN